MPRPKKDSYKEFDNEKNSCGSKIPHSPHNFSNGASLKSCSNPCGGSLFTFESINALLTFTRFNFA